METPSGKWAGDENFPVASRLIARPLRPHVMRYYAFARTIDDVADSPDLSPAEKCKRLDAFGAALTDPRHDEPGLTTAHRLRESLAQTGVPAEHGLDLVRAFKQDATKGRYTDWADLMGYCRYSASPVGRYLLDLHGEDRGLWPYSDALCNLLQVLNHLQDCREDYERLDRVYLPRPWLLAEGVDVDALARDRASRGVRAVLDRCLNGVDTLLPWADELPHRLRDRRLAMESAAILRLGHALAARLRRGDPLAGRVAVPKPVMAATGFWSAARILVARATGAPAPPQPSREPRG